MRKTLKGSRFYIINKHGNAEKALNPSGKCFKIGSDIFCDLRIKSPFVRGVHCKIYIDSHGQIVIKNYDMKSPVKLNNIPMNSNKFLHNNDTIEIYKRTFRWELKKKIEQNHKAKRWSELIRIKNQNKVLSEINTEKIENNESSDTFTIEQNDGIAEKSQKVLNTSILNFVSKRKRTSQFCFRTPIKSKTLKFMKKRITIHDFERLSATDSEEEIENGNDNVLHGKGETSIINTPTKKNSPEQIFPLECSTPFHPNLKHQVEMEMKNIFSTNTATTTKGVYNTPKSVLFDTNTLTDSNIIDLITPEHSVKNSDLVTPDNSVESPVILITPTKINKNSVNLLKLTLKKELGKTPTTTKLHTTPTPIKPKIEGSLRLEMEESPRSKRVTKTPKKFNDFKVTTPNKTSIINSNKVDSTTVDINSEKLRNLKNNTSEIDIIDDLTDGSNTKTLKTPKKVKMNRLDDEIEKASPRRTPRTRNIAAEVTTELDKISRTPKSSQNKTSEVDLNLTNTPKKNITKAPRKDTKIFQIDEELDAPILQKSVLNVTNVKNVIKTPKKRLTSATLEGIDTPKKIKLTRNSKADVNTSTGKEKSTPRKYSKVFQIDEESNNSTLTNVTEVKKTTNTPKISLKVLSSKVNIQSETIENIAGKIKVKKVINTPKKVLIETKTNSAKNNFETPKKFLKSNNLDDDVDKITTRKSKVSDIGSIINQAESLDDVESDKSEIILKTSPIINEYKTIDETFDILCGKPTIKHTYSRKSKSLSPLCDIKSNAVIKPNIENWINSVSNIKHDDINKATPNNNRQILSERYSNVTPHKPDELKNIQKTENNDVSMCFETEIDDSGIEHIAKITPAKGKQFTVQANHQSRSSMRRLSVRNKQIASVNVSRLKIVPSDSETDDLNKNTKENSVKNEVINPEKKKSLSSNVTLSFGNKSTVSVHDFHMEIPDVRYDAKIIDDDLTEDSVNIENEVINLEKKKSLSPNVTLSLGNKSSVSVHDLQMHTSDADSDAEVLDEDLNEDSIVIENEVITLEKKKSLSPNVTLSLENKSTVSVQGLQMETSDADFDAEVLDEDLNEDSIVIENEVITLEKKKSLSPNVTLSLGNKSSVSVQGLQMETSDADFDAEVLDEDLNEDSLIIENEVLNSEKKKSLSPNVTLSLGNKSTVSVHDFHMEIPDVRYDAKIIDDDLTEDSVNIENEVINPDKKKSLSPNVTLSLGNKSTVSVRGLQMKTSDAGSDAEIADDDLNEDSVEIENEFINSEKKKSLSPNVTLSLGNKSSVSVHGLQMKSFDAGSDAEIVDDDLNENSIIIENEVITLEKKKSLSPNVTLSLENKSTVSVQGLQMETSDADFDAEVLDEDLNEDSIVIENEVITLEKKKSLSPNVTLSLENKSTVSVQGLQMETSDADFDAEVLDEDLNEDSLIIENEVLNPEKKKSLSPNVTLSLGNKSTVSVHDFHMEIPDVRYDAKIIDDDLTEDSVNIENEVINLEKKKSLSPNVTLSLGNKSSVSVHDLQMHTSDADSDAEVLDEDLNVDSLIIENEVLNPEKKKTLSPNVTLSLGNKSILSVHGLQIQTSDADAVVLDDDLNGNSVVIENKVISPEKKKSLSPNVTLSLGNKSTVSVHGLQMQTSDADSDAEVLDDDLNENSVVIENKVITPEKKKSLSPNVTLSLGNKSTVSVRGLQIQTSTITTPTKKNSPQQIFPLECSTPFNPNFKHQVDMKNIFSTNKSITTKSASETPKRVYHTPKRVLCDTNTLIDSNIIDLITPKIFVKKSLSRGNKSTVSVQGLQKMKTSIAGSDDDDLNEISGIIENIVVTPEKKKSLSPNVTLSLGNKSSVSVQGFQLKKNDAGSDAEVLDEDLNEDSVVIENEEKKKLLSPNVTLSLGNNSTVSVHGLQMQASDADSDAEVLDEDLNEDSLIIENEVLNPEKKKSLSPNVPLAHGNKSTLSNHGLQMQTSDADSDAEVLDDDLNENSVVIENEVLNTDKKKSLSPNVPLAHGNKSTLSVYGLQMQTSDAEVLDDDLNENSVVTENKVITPEKKKSLSPNVTLSLGNKSSVSVQGLQLKKNDAGSDAEVLDEDLNEDSVVIENEEKKKLLSPNVTLSLGNNSTVSVHGLQMQASDAEVLDEDLNEDSLIIENEVLNPDKNKSLSPNVPLAHGNKSTLSNHGLQMQTSDAEVLDDDLNENSVVIENKVITPEKKKSLSPNVTLSLGNKSSVSVQGLQLKTNDAGSDAEVLDEDLNEDLVIIENEEKKKSLSPNVTLSHGNKTTVSVHGLQMQTSDADFDAEVLDEDLNEDSLIIENEVINPDKKKSLSANVSLSHGNKSNVSIDSIQMKSCDSKSDAEIVEEKLILNTLSSNSTFDKSENKLQVSYDKSSLSMEKEDLFDESMKVEHNNEKLGSIKTGEPSAKVISKLECSSHGITEFSNSEVILVDANGEFNIEIDENIKRFIVLENKINSENVIEEQEKTSVVIPKKKISLTLKSRASFQNQSTISQNGIQLESTFSENNNNFNLDLQNDNSEKNLETSQKNQSNAAPVNSLETDGIVGVEVKLKQNPVLVLSNIKSPKPRKNLSLSLNKSSKFKPNVKTDEIKLQENEEINTSSSSNEKLSSKNDENILDKYVQIIETKENSESVVKITESVIEITEPIEIYENYEVLSKNETQFKKIKMSNHSTPLSKNMSKESELIFEKPKVERVEKIIVEEEISLRRSPRRAVVQSKIDKQDSTKRGRKLIVSIPIKKDIVDLVENEVKQTKRGQKEVVDNESPQKLSKLSSEAPILENNGNINTNSIVVTPMKHGRKKVIVEDEEEDNNETKSPLAVKIPFRRGRKKVVEEIGLTPKSVSHEKAENEQPSELKVVQTTSTKKEKRGRPKKVVTETELTSDIAYQSQNSAIIVPLKQAKRGRKKVVLEADIKSEIVSHEQADEEPSSVLEPVHETPAKKETRGRNKVVLEGKLKSAIVSHEQSEKEPSSELIPVKTTTPKQGKRGRKKVGLEDELKQEIVPLEQAEKEPSSEFIPVKTTTPKQEKRGRKKVGLEDELEPEIVPLEQAEKEPSSEFIPVKTTNPKQEKRGRKKVGLEDELKQEIVSLEQAKKEPSSELIPVKTTPPKQEKRGRKKVVLEDELKPEIVPLEQAEKEPSSELIPVKTTPPKPEKRGRKKVVLEDELKPEIVPLEQAEKEPSSELIPVKTTPPKPEKRGRKKVVLEDELKPEIVSLEQAEKQPSSELKVVQEKIVNEIKSRKEKNRGRREERDKDTPPPLKKKRELNPNFDVDSPKLRRTVKTKLIEEAGKEEKEEQVVSIKGKRTKNQTEKPIIVDAMEIEGKQMIEIGNDSDLKEKVSDVNLKTTRKRIQEKESLDKKESIEENERSKPMRKRKSSEVEPTIVQEKKRGRKKEMVETEKKAEPSPIVGRVTRSRKALQ